jgi:hypothetical protein
MNDDLAGCSLADVLEKLEKGKIGHRAPGHQPMRVPPLTLEFRTIARRPATPDPDPRRPRHRDEHGVLRRCSHDLA